MKLAQDQKDTIVHIYHSLGGIREMIKSGDFESKLSIPEKHTFSTCEHCGSRYKNMDAEASYKQEMKKYRDERYLKRELFKYICMFDLGLEYENKASEKVYEMAWDRGASAGLHEVYDELVELAELLTIARKY